ncbi:MAG: ribosome recycling factor [Candidatus Hodgkinia cicadicola]
MLKAMAVINTRAANELQQVLNKFKAKSSLFFVDKITISMISHIVVGNRNLSSICSFRQLPNGGIELSFFERANVKSAIQAIRVSGLGLSAEFKLGNVHVFFADTASSRRDSVIKELFLVLEQFKQNVRAIRRRSILELKKIKAVECDLKRLYLKQVEGSVLKTLRELQCLYDINEQRLRLSC